MAEAAMLCGPMVGSQELSFKLRNGGELGSRGVFPFHGSSIRARECSSCARVSVPGPNCSSAGNSSGTIRSVSGGSSGKCRRRVEAGVSQSRASQLTSSKRDGVAENDAADRTIPTGLDELNSVQDSGSGNGRRSVSGKGENGHGTREQKEGRTDGLFDILARDVEVIRGGAGRLERMLLRESEAGAGKLMKSRGDAVQETSEALHPRKKEGLLETVGRDGEAVQESTSSAGKNFQGLLPLTRDEGKGSSSSSKLHGADEGNQGSDFPSRTNSALGKRKEGFVSLERLKGSLIQAGDSVVKWAERVGKRTGVGKIVLGDVEFIRDSINSVQEEVGEVLRMRKWEDPLVAGEIRPPWPELAYSGLSGKDLVAADIEALKSYGNYFRGFLSTWRIPLQLSYDPEAVASYFNRRPHLVLFRFLETQQRTPARLMSPSEEHGVARSLITCGFLVKVSAAFSGVAFQLLLEKARIRRDQSSSRIGESDGGQSTRKNAEALKQTLLRLGPTFIKVAQSLSSRPDLIGIETAKVLSELQDRLPPFPTEEAMAVIELELGVPVFRGRTLEGEEVAVKVQRPDLLFDVALDIYVFRLGLGILRKVAKMNSDISVLADELGYGLFGELDYTLEATNAKEFGALVRHLSYVKVPRALPRLTRKRVLTMEWMTGYRPLDLQLIAEGNLLSEEGLSGLSRQEAKLYLDDLVRKGVECSLVQLLETGVMHADPHPGNLLYTKEGTLVYLDFGLLARVSKKHRAAMLAVIAHLVNAEWQCLANDFADLDILKPSTDRFALRLALEQAFGEGPDAVVKNGVPDIQFGQVTGKLWKIALKFRFRLPAYYTLVLRALASLEGIAVSGDPNYKVFAAAYPYVVRRLLSDNSHPSRRVFQSLVLTQKKEFRWERIAEIMTTSRKRTSHDIVVRGTARPPAAAHLPGPKSRKLLDGNALASVLLSFTLSKEGGSVRRVLLEADTKSLAKAFISPSASSLRRKVSIALAESLYLWLPTFGDEAGARWTSTPTGAGRGQGTAKDSVTSTTEVTQHDPEIKSVMNAENLGSSQVSMEPSVNGHRLWFLVKVLTSRLRSSPILMLRVSWAFVTMVAFATALALHKYAISLSDRLLEVQTNRTLDIIPRPVDVHSNVQLQGDSVSTV